MSEERNIVDTPVPSDAQLAERMYMLALDKLNAKDEEIAMLRRQLIGESTPEEKRLENLREEALSWGRSMVAELHFRQDEAQAYRKIIQANVDNNDAEYDMSVEMTVLAKYEAMPYFEDIPPGKGWTLSTEEYEIIHKSAISFAESKHSRGNGESDNRRLAFVLGAFFGIKLRSIPDAPPTERLTMTESQKRAFGKVHAMAFMRWCARHRFRFAAGAGYVITIEGVERYCINLEVVYDKFLSEELANFHNKINPNE